MSFHKVFHLGQFASRKGNKLLAKICRAIVVIRYNSDISLEADIAESVYFCHNGFGTVINPLT